MSSCIGLVAIDAFSPIRSDLLVRLGPSITNLSGGAPAQSGSSYPTVRVITDEPSWGLSVGGYVCNVYAHPARVLRTELETPS